MTGLDQELREVRSCLVLALGQGVASHALVGPLASASTQRQVPVRELGGAETRGQSAERVAHVALEALGHVVADQLTLTLRERVGGAQAQGRCLGGDDVDGHGTFDVLERVESGHDVVLLLHFVG